jgi:hypothetical protein
MEKDKNNKQINQINQNRKIKIKAPNNFNNYYYFCKSIILMHLRKKHRH